MSRYWAMDVGGSHVACALVEGANVLGRETIPVPDARSFAALLPRIEASFDRLGGAPDGLAVAFPALVDPVHVRVLATPRDKYEDAVGFDFRAWASSRLDVPVRLELDGRMALLGERYAGALVGADDAVMLTFGTGIGTAALIGGKLLRGRNHRAGVLGGHLSLSAHGRPCICGGIGCSEAEASGWALPALAGESPGFAASGLAAEPRIDFATVFRLAAEGDGVADALADTVVEHWAVATLNMVQCYDPQVVVLAGGAMAAVDRILPRIRAFVAAHAWCHDAPPEIRCGALGSDAALLGAEPLFSGSA